MAKPRPQGGEEVWMAEEGGEETLLELNPAMFRNQPVGFVLSLILCAVGVGLVILGVWWLQTKAATLTVTSKRTIQRTGLLSKRTTEVLHRDVRNIQVSQSVFQRMCGVGTIGISSAGQSGVEILFPGVRDPEGVQAVIDEHRDL